jgi:MiaB/RimO family radical SAM methylthiotransferase
MTIATIKAKAGKKILGCEMTKKAYICSGACDEARHDSARVEEFLKRNNWTITDELKHADLIVFHACGLTSLAQKTSIEAVREIHAKKKAEARLVVWGCLPRINPQLLKEVYDGPLIGVDDIAFFNDIIQANTKIEEVEVNCIANYKPLTSEKTWPGLSIDWYYYKLLKICAPEVNPSFFYIRVATGCLGSCTYCAIRFSRGRVRSKPIEKIIVEFHKGLQLGYKHFALLGTDLGCYGRDLGYTLADLLREMIKKEGDYKINLTNINPHYLIEMLNDMKEVFRSGKIWILGIPVQSGSNRILKLMARKYSVEEFKKCIRTLNREFPNIIIRTQFMVGFPTETEEDLKETIKLMKEVEFDFVELFKFSKRPRTPAGDFDGQIPEEIVEKRYRKLQLKAMSDAILKKFKRTLKLNKNVKS